MQLCRLFLRSSAIVFALVALGCSEQEVQEEVRQNESGDAALDAVARGKHYYESVCTACHHGDPSQSGTIGPALAGASLELLEAMVLRGEYPPGYTPKQPGGAMPVFQFLEPELPNIAAYLASVPTD